MQPGKIHLLHSGGTNPPGISQVIAASVGNRLYRITNDGAGNGAPGSMRIAATRTVWFWTVTSLFDLDAGRSIDVLGSTITVSALETLQLFGSYDTI